jgi:hypothetical protein
MSCCAELADYEWLTGDEAADLLGDLAGRAEAVHTTIARLRKTLSASRASLVVEQVALRQRARAKFRFADRMFFTRLGLEQATDEWVATYKARRFAAVANRGPIAEFCCGIGGDLLSLGRVGQAVGVDRDPIAACFAAANARAAGLNDRVTLQACEIGSLNAGDFAAWHIDPDRRPTGKRTTALEWSSPSLEVIERLLATSPNAAIKLAPAADSPPTLAERCELEWISRDRQCRQLVAWHGALAAHPGQCRATVLARDGTVLRTIVGQRNQPLIYAPLLDQYLFEPDAAVLAAHLPGAIAAEHSLATISPGIAYLTGPRPIDDPALTPFEVDEVLPLDVRKIAARLRERQIGTLEIKKRGVDHEPVAVRKQLQLHGENTAVLFLTKIAGKHAAILAHRTHNPQH